MPPAVEKLAKKFLRHPAIVCIGDEDSGKNKRIRQHVLFISEQQKKQTLIDLLRRKQPNEKYLVFCNEKRGCDALKKVVENAQIRCGVLHGGKTQDQREAALENYKRGTFRILIATDVAGRGLDIPDVAHVVNFDMPLKIENYSHRIGRTGRAGKDGVASTLLTDSDEAMFYELREYLEQTDADIPQKLEKHPAAHAKPASGTRAASCLLRELECGGRSSSTRGSSSRGASERAMPIECQNRRARGRARLAPACEAPQAKQRTMTAAKASHEHFGWCDAAPYRRRRPACGRGAKGQNATSARGVHPQLGPVRRHYSHLKHLNHFEEAKSLLQKTMPVARRVLSDMYIGLDLTLAMRWIYAGVLYWDASATLGDLRELA